MKRAAMLTSTGFIRDNNEDCAAIDGRIAVENLLAGMELQGDHHLLVVADGVGGYDFGEVASRAAVETLIGLSPTMLDETACAAAVVTAHRHLFDLMRHDPAIAGMGTTIVGFAVIGDRAICFNAGDSRAYLYRDGLKQLSTDHVPLRDLSEFGHRSHMLTQWLGGRDEDDEVFPALGTLDLMPGDRLVLCSDGLTDVLSDEDIEDILLQCRTPDDAARTLVDMVLSLGAPDNVTVIVAG